MLLQFLKEKSQELNFTKIRGSCRENLKPRNAGKEEKKKMYLTEQKPCNLLPQIEKKKKRKQM